MARHGRDKYIYLLCRPIFFGRAGGQGSQVQASQLAWQLWTRSPRGARLLRTAETETMRLGLAMPMRIAPTVHRLGKRAGLACLTDGHCAGRYRSLGWVSGQTQATGDDQSQQQRSHCVLLSPLRLMQGVAVTRSCYGWPVVRNRRPGPH
jgi:hypothetical protein